MAGNLLPLLLVGGAVAYVLSSKKTSEKKSCPPSTDITIGQMEAAGKIVYPMMKEGADPRVLVTAYLRELLPPGCSRMSKDSHVVLVVKDGEGKDRRFKMTVPDFYMITIIDAAGSFFENQIIDKATYDRIAQEELEWYKKLMGKQFDSTSLGLDPLAEILYEGEDGFEGDFQEFDDASGPRPKQPSACPASLKLEMDDFQPVMVDLEEPFQVGEGQYIEQLSIPALALAEIEAGNRDAVDIANELWASVMPSACQPDNKQIEITMVGPQGQMAVMGAGDLYLSLFGMTADFMYVTGAINEQGYGTQTAVMEAWWAENYGGQPFPPGGKNVA